MQRLKFSLNAPPSPPPEERTLNDAAAASLFKKLNFSSKTLKAFFLFHSSLKVRWEGVERKKRKKERKKKGGGGGGRKKEKKWGKLLLGNFSLSDSTAL